MMRDLSLESQPAVGLAYSDYVPMFLTEHPDAIDFVEIPFEVLRHNPSVSELQRFKPLILHCASLSMAGFVPPDEQTIALVKSWTKKTKTPWLGEHLAFVTAERAEAMVPGSINFPVDVYDVGYSVNPPANTASLEQILLAVEKYEKCLGVPILLENSPVYFVPPGSTMTQIEFMKEICAHSSAQLLLDLTHFYITSQMLGFDPLKEILKLPLERVIEVHISGVDQHDGNYWDDHTKRAPKIVFDLFALVLANSQLRAVTLEYNWSVNFPKTVLLEEIARSRDVIATAVGCS